MAANQEATEMLDQLSRRFITRWNQVENLVVMADILTSAHWPNRNDAESKKGTLAAASGLDTLRAGQLERMYGLMQKGFDVTVESAAIVLAHSVIDKFVYGLCQISSIVSPMDWLSNIEKRKIVIADLAETSFDIEYNKKLEDYISKLEKESLLFKIQKLFSKCKPNRAFNPVPDYIYDSNRLEKFHNKRIEIVHGFDSLYEIPDVDEKLVYIEKTALYFYSMFDHKYGDAIDPKVRRTLFVLFESRLNPSGD